MSRKTGKSTQAKKSDADQGSPPLLGKAANFCSYYANNTTFQMTPWDVSLTFGRITDIKDGKAIVEQLAQVNMSLQHAKAVVGILSRQLEKYEEVHGKLALGPTYAVTERSS